MVTLNRRYKFCASHRLHVSDFGEDRNRELFGKCNNPFGHGHNYEIEISVEGPIEPRTGRVVDPSRLDDFVQRTIVNRYDHRYLNEELPEFGQTVPTTENLGRQIEFLLREGWPAAFQNGEPRLTRIRIFETERNSFELTVR
jgi:6-pyruvoyltetrahydropterin/6-carboxytetrahydropterin synthase